MILYKSVIKLLITCLILLVLSISIGYLLVIFQKQYVSSQIATEVLNKLLEKEKLAHTYREEHKKELSERSENDKGTSD